MSRPEPETWQDFHFPAAGLDTAGPFGRQPNRQGPDGSYVRTTTTGVNCRSFDPVSLRSRGGSRVGQSKYIVGQVPAPLVAGAWVVQHVNSLVTTAGTLGMSETSLSGRVVYLVAVSQGTVSVATPGDTVWTATVNNTGETPPLNFSGVMQSAANNQLLYFTDGTNYAFYQPPTNSVEAWVPSSGLMPRDSANNGARLICTWRGRTVLSGLLKDPQNWFMSAVSDPTNWNYNPVPTTATQAVAGNNSQLGFIGDVVTGLIPYTDDLLIFLGNSSIYAMRGDPADGGRIDRVSDITGGAFGQAWCKDPYGTIYFFGSRPSVWSMVPGQLPQRISQPIEPLIANLNTGDLIINMAWNDRQQAVHVFLTLSTAPAATTHYVWEYRSNSWWQDTFANTNLNPLSIVQYDGNLPNDRAVLLGGWDGFVRFIDPSASTDDTTPITSTVLIGPIMTQQLDEMLLKDIQIVLAEASGQVTWSILAGKTAEAAVAAAATVSGTAVGSRNPNRPVRVAAHAIYIQLQSTNRWAMEAIRTRFQGKGKVRRRTPN
jgi:hypothetical protein